MQQLSVCTESEAGYHRCVIIVHQRLHNSGGQVGWKLLCEVDFWKQDDAMLNSRCLLSAQCLPFLHFCFWQCVLQTGI